MQRSMQEIVPRLAELLETHNETPWAVAFRRIVSEYDDDPAEAKANIRRLYGGMGSFTDLVLHKDGDWISLRAENDELDRLRWELLAAC